MSHDQTGFIYTQFDHKRVVSLPSSQAIASNQAPLDTMIVTPVKQLSRIVVDASPGLEEFYYSTDNPSDDAVSIDFPGDFVIEYAFLQKPSGLGAYPGM
jgi:hypothetical protein